MLGGRSWDSWIAEYSESHQHPLNRLTHTFGIPIIMLSLPLLVLGIVWRAGLWAGVTLFVAGWALQFIGHAIEGKPPEFLKDWRFLLVGSRWWFAKMRGKAEIFGWSEGTAPSNASPDRVTIRLCLLDSDDHGVRADEMFDAG